MRRAGWRPVRPEVHAHLAGQALLSAELGMLSLGAVLPALVGMTMGQRLRRRIDEAHFRRVFLLALALLGVAIVARAAL